MTTYEEAYRVRNMGSTQEIEDRTNPVTKFRCIRCGAIDFLRWYVALGLWPYHCQEMMIYQRKAEGQAEGQR